MISHETKMHKQFLKIRKAKSLLLTRQEGVSLLMALLVLGALMAISFSVATIVFVEIRASGDVARTERALYSAYAVTEEALFKNQRQASDLIYVTSLNGVDLTSTEELTSTSPYTDSIPAGTTKQYVLVDPNDPNGPGGYGGIKVVYASSGSDVIQVSLFEINPNPIPPDSGISPLPPDTLEYFNDSWEKLDLSVGMQYQLDIKNDSGNAVSVNIYSYDGGTPQLDKGLPNIGTVNVDIIAKYLGLTRKYQAIIPK
jgi:hypothetical protein